MPILIHYDGKPVNLEIARALYPAGVVTQTDMGDAWDADIDKATGVIGTHPAHQGFVWILEENYDKITNVPKLYKRKLL